MMWALLGVLLPLFLVAVLARRRFRLVPGPRPSPHIVTGVEGARRVGKRTRNALDAASAMLR